MRRVGVELMGCLLILLAALGRARRRRSASTGSGGDYTSFPVRSGDPAQCAARCERDQRCRAWAFSYPVTENAAAICWLKSRVPPRVAASCCVSGVRGAGVIEPRSEPIEFGIDRYRRRLPQLRAAARPDRQELRRRLRRRSRNAGPGPMPGPAMAAPRPAAFSRIGSPARSTGPAAFRAWCGSGRAQRLETGELSRCRRP